MAGKLQVRVITPETVVYEGTADSVRFPAEDGLYGVLPNHAPMITTVGAGVVTLKEDGRAHHLFVSRGFAQVSKNQLRFAVDSGEDEDDIDLERARRAAERARERLQEMKQKDIDYLRAQYALRRALMRLRVKGALRD